MAVVPVTGPEAGEREHTRVFLKMKFF